MRHRQPPHIIDPIKNTKILLYAFCLALIIGMIGVGNTVKDLNQKLLNKESQINVLTDEIGKLQEENVYLYENILVNRDYTEKSLNVLHNSFIDFIDDKENETESLKSQKDTLQTKFLDVKNDLLSLLGEKEYAIEKLHERNEKLTNEIEYLNYDDEITDILLLGKNELLTDTIIIASVNPSNETISLFSIPRDLFVNGRKINSILASLGIEKLKRDIYTITGIYTDKYVIVDFEAFENVINLIGGIDLYVRKDIYDPYFPTSNNGYTVYSIEEGSHHMDGKEALMYARSRKTTSDFDRSERQQQIIQAIRVKLKRFNLLDDLEKTIKLFQEAANGINTDIDVFEALYYLKNYQNYPIERNNVLSSSNLLYSSKTIDGQYILLPKTGDYHEIKRQISQLINS